MQIATQGIKYAGSKLTLIPQILSMIPSDVTTIFDAFSGTTRVSQAFAKSNHRVIANDISAWSYIFGIAYLKNKEDPNYYNKLIEHLNKIDGYDGWFTQVYGGYDYNGSAIQLDGSKKPFQVHNTRKLDAVRAEIDKLNLSEIDMAVVLTSLILALDKVDNTLGHHTSYLRNWSKRSYGDMLLEVPMLFVNTKDNEVYKNDAISLAKNISADLAYLDPPYGSNNKKMPHQECAMLHIIIYGQQ